MAAGGRTAARRGRRSLRTLACAVCVVLSAAAPALAQQSRTNHRATADAQAVADGDELSPEHLLGDWNGLRPHLAARGVDLSLSYTSETTAVVAGACQGVDYAHSINALADIDLQTLIGAQGLSFHTAVVERAGRNASRDYLLDSLDQVQEIYGSGGDVGAHLVYLFLEQKAAGGHLDLQAGRLDVGQDFAASPIYCDFLNLALCPNPRALTAAQGFTVFPTATWGARLKLSGNLERVPAYLQVGAFQVRRQGGGRSGFDVSTTGTSGALLPFEVGLTPRFGPDALVGHYKIGVAENTSKAKDLWEAQDGGPLALGDGRVARTHRGQVLAYASADQMVVRTGPNGTDGVLVFGAYDRVDPHTAMIDQTAVVGLLARGVVPGRPGDTVGLMTTWLGVSDRLTATERLQALLNGAVDPLSSGAASASNDIQTSETVLEAVYNARLREGLHLVPDLQYVHRPNGSSATPDGVVLALRLSVDL